MQINSDFYGTLPQITLISKMFGIPVEIIWAIIGISILLTIFHLWMLFSAIGKGEWGWAFVIFFIPFGSWIYFFKGKLSS